MVSPPSENYFDFKGFPILLLTRVAFSGDKVDRIFAFWRSSPMAPRMSINKSSSRVSSILAASSGRIAL